MSSSNKSFDEMTEEEILQYLKEEELLSPRDYDMFVRTNKSLAMSLPEDHPLRRVVEKLIKRKSIN